jgi:flagellar biosynthetic protein FliP
MNDLRQLRCRRIVAAVLLPLCLLVAGAVPGGDTSSTPNLDRTAPSGPFALDFGSGAGSEASPFRSIEPPEPEKTARHKLPLLDAQDALRSAQTVMIYGLIWLAPMAALVVTAFVRINIVLVLLRQALGSPQVPDNQVLMVLALLLTTLVMRPTGEQVYKEAIVPYQVGQATAAEAWAAGSAPIKAFMVDQIVRTKHQDYLWTLYHYAVPTSADQPQPEYAHEFPFRVVAPAYLLSELTTALVMGFFLYLPFLVIDLVVSAVLAAMGLYMLPPTLVAMPMKLIVFVLADGWLLVSSMLLSSFAVGGAR